MTTELPTTCGAAVRSSDLLDRWEVQRHDMLRGWNTWVIYDEQHHAETECSRRISESPERDKRSWRVAKRSNDKDVQPKERQ